MLRLKLFGTPALLRDGVPLDGPAAQRRRLALLAILARTDRRGVSRDRVLALLWPGTPEERARPALAQALHAIRRELGDERVIAGSGELRVDADHLPSDVAEFERALAEGDDAGADRAWTGPFLDGFRLPDVPTFDRWADDQRDQLANDWAALVERLARAADRAGAHAEAIRHWRRLAGHDPLSGRVAQALVRALAAAGDREAALRQVRVYEALVRSELDTELDASWAALERELRAVAIPRAAVGERVEAAVERADERAVEAPASGPPVLPEVRPGAAWAPAATAAAAVATVMAAPSPVAVLPAVAATAPAAAAPSAAAPPGAAPPPAAPDRAAPDRGDGAPARVRPRRGLLVAGVAMALGAGAWVARPRGDAAVARAATRSATASRYVEEAGRLVRFNTGGTTAVRLYEAALAEDPRFARAALELARLTEGMQGGPATARALALAAGAPRALALRIRAEHALAVDDVQVAALADSLLALAPGDASTQVFVGRARHHLGDYAGAVAAFERAWALDSAAVRDRTRPECPACDAVGGLVGALRGLDSADAAVARARRWVAADRAGWQPWSQLADVLVYAGRWAEAATAIDSMAVRGGPEESHFRLFLAQQAGDSAAFERALVAARRAGRDTADLRWRTLLMRRDQGRLDEALALARAHRAAASRGAPGVPTDANGEALVRLARGEWRAAAALFDSIARNLPDSARPGTRARHVTWYRTLGAEARAAGGDTTGLAALADTLAVLGQQSAYGRDRLLHHHVRGLLLEARGDTAAAIGRFRAAMVSPVLGFTRSNLHLARLHLAQGRPLEAAATLRPALGALSIGGPGVYASRRELRALLAAAQGR